MSENNSNLESTFNQIIKGLNRAVVNLQAQCPQPERLFTPEGEVIEVPKEEKERIVKERKVTLDRINAEESNGSNF